VAVDTARASVEPDGNLRLIIDLQSQSRFRGGFDPYGLNEIYYRQSDPLQKLAYQVNVITNARTVRTP